MSHVKGAYFYSGNQHGGKRSLVNTGRTHKWSTHNRDRDGDTFCVKRQRVFESKFEYNSEFETANCILPAVNSPRPGNYSNAPVK